MFSVQQYATCCGARIIYDFNDLTSTPANITRMARELKGIMDDTHGRIFTAIVTQNQPLAIAALKQAGFQLVGEVINGNSNNRLFHYQFILPYDENFEEDEDEDEYDVWDI